MASETKKQDDKSGKAIDPEEIVNGFQALRTEQRLLSTKLSEVEVDSNEHKLVIQTLKNVNADRKCFRSVGGVLVQQTVKDVLPQLESNLIKLLELIKILNEQIIRKGEEINDYKEKYGIKIRSVDEKDDPNDDAQKSEPTNRGNVLVS